MAKKKAGKQRPKGFQPVAQPHSSGRAGAPRWTDPAERRSGQVRGQEPHGQGARQMSRDPADGGRPRGRRR